MSDSNICTEYDEARQWGGYGRKDNDEKKCPKCGAELEVQGIETYRCASYNRWHKYSQRDSVTGKDGYWTFHESKTCLRNQFASEKAENRLLKKAIEDFGRNPAGFDWAVLGKIDNLETENKLLRDAVLSQGRALDRIDDLIVPESEVSLYSVEQDEDAVVDRVAKLVKQLRETVERVAKYTFENADGCDPFCCKIYLDEISEMVAAEATK